MPTFLRVVLALVAIWLADRVVTVAFAFFPLGHARLEASVALACGICSGAIAWYVGAADGGRRLATVLATAALGGLIGFALGFFGPMWLAPDANQGPLLGFFTGSAGFFLGALVGCVRAFARKA